MFQGAVAKAPPIFEQLVSDWLDSLQSDQLSAISFQQKIVADDLNLNSDDPPSPILDLQSSILNLLLISDLLGRAQILAKRDAVEFTEVEIDWELKPEEALKFLRAKVPMTRKEFDQLEDIYRFRAWTVAGITSLDVLNDIKQLLVKNLDDGGTLRDFRLNLTDHLKKVGIEPTSKWHIENVYRTNSQAAYSAGRMAQIRELSDEFPMIEYVAVMDDRTSKICGGLDGMIKPTNDPFWSRYTPPNHFQCRSTVRPLHITEIEDNDIKPTRGKPPVEPQEGFDASPAEMLRTLPNSMQKRAEEYGLEVKGKRLPRSSTTETKRPRPTTQDELQSAIKQLQKEFKGKKQKIKTFDWQMNDPRCRGYWVPKLKTLAIHRTVTPEILSALRKLANNISPTTGEIEALRTLWHEINHSRGFQDLRGQYKKIKGQWERNNPRIFEIEAINELHTRLTFDQFIEDLGYDPKLTNPLQDYVIKAQGYYWYMDDLVETLQVAGITKTEALTFVEDLNYKKSTKVYLVELNKWVGEKLGSDDVEIERLYNLLKHSLVTRDSISLWRSEVDRLAALRGISRESWVTPR